MAVSFKPPPPPPLPTSSTPSPFRYYKGPTSPKPRGKREEASGMESSADKEDPSSSKSHDANPPKSRIYLDSSLESSYSYGGEKGVPQAHNSGAASPIVISLDDAGSDSDESLPTVEEIRNDVDANAEPADSHTPATSELNNQRALPTSTWSQADSECKSTPCKSILLKINSFSL
jgi:hypothetical protein